ncbi:hypothetical protein [Vibrio sp. TRT 17S01]|uniref:hypothetical protein n=1 Tax=Vibrio sp. TRT 17S01 TaxID=3418505 RepID=UPI003CF90BB8
MKNISFTSAALLHQKQEEKLNECREATIEKLVINLCVEANFLTKQDIQQGSIRYQWVLKITEYCIDATYLEDVEEGETPLPLTYLNCDKIVAENKKKAEAIVKVIAKEIMRGLPLYQG